MTRQRYLTDVSPEETAELIADQRMLLDMLTPADFDRRRRQQLQQQGEREGRLIQETTHDNAGRPVHRFYGSPEECWGPFKFPTKVITGFKR